MSLINNLYWCFRSLIWVLHLRARRSANTLREKERLLNHVPEKSTATLTSGRYRVYIHCVRRIAARFQRILKYKSTGRIWTTYIMRLFSLVTLWTSCSSCESSGPPNSYRFECFNALILDVTVWVSSLFSNFRNCWSCELSEPIDEWVISAKSLFALHRHDLSSLYQGLLCYRCSLVPRRSVSYLYIRYFRKRFHWISVPVFLLCAWSKSFVFTLFYLTKGVSQGILLPVRISTLWNSIVF